MKTKNNAITLVRLPDDIKKQFQELCEKELISMSVKIRQLIHKELNKEK